MRRKGLTIFWPQYFDKSRTVNMGRKISLESATEKPILKDLATAAQKLKFKYEIDPRSKYPRSTWDEPGLLLVDTLGQKKNDVLKKMAPEIQKARTNRLKQLKESKVKKKHKKKAQQADILRQKIAQQRKKK
ncbi:hypothetical protein NEF87_004236 [Candidatus Lokiarchaeum ossiferum]|uniref:Signal recognition particle 19 kDa protein n=1 Tax=Candidatus Lokiarchaeum ossiferum TaxID=2951803 RepID=A0ABY6HWP6_9ARCH|nr:hypothetical protein NEF87_004236 [Candidatus Lokiarchaeum sp. B-35]